MLLSLLTVFVGFSAGQYTCQNGARGHRVCATDQCKATWSNPLEQGKEYKFEKRLSDRGCCFGWMGACDLCCEVPDVPSHPDDCKAWMDPNCSTQQCKTWADRGECDENPTYMLPMCPSQCNCRDHNDPNCSHEQCKEWARRGECDINPSYMRKMCVSVCDCAAWDDKQCSTKQCTTWAKRGECTNNPKYMLPMCPDPCTLDNMSGCTDSPGKPASSPHISGYRWSHNGYWGGYISRGYTSSVQQCASECDSGKVPGCAGFSRNRNSGTCYVYTDTSGPHNPNHGGADTNDDAYEKCDSVLMPKSTVNIPAPSMNDMFGAFTSSVGGVFEKPRSHYPAAPMQTPPGTTGDEGMTMMGMPSVEGGVRTYYGQQQPTSYSQPPSSYGNTYRSYQPPASYYGQQPTSYSRGFTSSWGRRLSDLNAGEEETGGEVPTHVRLIAGEA